MQVVIEEIKIIHSYIIGIHNKRIREENKDWTIMDKYNNSMEEVIARHLSTSPAQDSHIWCAYLQRSKNNKYTL